MSLWDSPALRLLTCFKLPEQHLQALKLVGIALQNRSFAAFIFDSSSVQAPAMELRRKRAR